MLHGMADRFRGRAILLRATTLTGATQAKPDVDGHVGIDDYLRQRRCRRRCGCWGRFFGSNGELLRLRRVPGVLKRLGSDLGLLDGVTVSFTSGALADSDEGDSQRLLEVRNVDGFTHMGAGGAGADAGADDETRGIGVFVGRVVAVVVARKLFLSHLLLAES